MGDVELTTLLTSLHGLVTDTRDRVLKVEGALDMLSSFKGQMADDVRAAHARIDSVEGEVAALRARDGAEDAVSAFRQEAKRDRRWLIGVGFTSTTTAVAVAGLLLTRLG